jgi:hypothetical protein
MSEVEGEAAAIAHGRRGSQRWSRIFAQGVKWNFCLTAGTIQGPRIRRDHEEESTPEPLTGLQS